MPRKYAMKGSEIHPSILDLPPREIIALHWPRFKPTRLKTRNHSGPTTARPDLELSNDKIPGRKRNSFVITRVHPQQIVIRVSFTYTLAALGQVRVHALYGNGIRYFCAISFLVEQLNYYPALQVKPAR